MDKDLLKAELEARIKASLCISGNSEALTLFSKIMNQVYDLQKDDNTLTSTAPVSRHSNTLEGANF